MTSKKTSYSWVNVLSSTESTQTACARVSGIEAVDQGYGVCASGELRPNSGEKFSAIAYKYGAWGGTMRGGQRVGSNCYMTGQKQDGDGTDIAVAVLCKIEATVDLNSL